MKYLFFILIQAIISTTAFGQTQRPSLYCTIGNNSFTVTFGHQVWSEVVPVYPWSTHYLVCGKNTTAAVVDNNFIFFSLKQNRISIFKIQSLDSKNVHLSIGDDVAALVVDNYLRIQSSKATYEQYFDSFSENVFLSIYNNLTAVIYGPDFIILDSGIHYKFKLAQSLSIQDKLFYAQYGFAVGSGNTFIVYDKFRNLFKSLKLRGHGKLQIINTLPTYILETGEKYIYNDRTGVFDQY